MKKYWFYIVIGLLVLLKVGLSLKEEEKPTMSKNLERKLERMPIQYTEVHWASEVLGFSSQYSDKKYSANQILGKPSAMPQGGSNPTAWCPSKQNNPEQEWIKVGFPHPILVQQIAISESYHPGTIDSIVFFGKSGQKETFVHEEKDPYASPRILSLFPPEYYFKTSAVKIFLSTQKTTGWNHIDAIGISESTTPIEAVINGPLEAYESDWKLLGHQINNDNTSEIMPVISPDGKQLFFDRKDHPDNIGDKENDDIWVSTLVENKWTKAINLGPPLNNSDHNYATSISADGNTLFLANTYKSNGKMGDGFSMTQRIKDGWGTPENFKFESYNNDSEYSESSIGPNKRVMIVAIETPETHGGRDLYYSILSGTRWSEPINMGGVINSASAEMAPFLARDGRTLYFSSQGFSGFGNNDIFMTRRRGTSWTDWTEPLNLGSSVNTPDWDAYISIDAGGENGYIATSFSASTDIAKLTLPEELRPDPMITISFQGTDQLDAPIDLQAEYVSIFDEEFKGKSSSNMKQGRNELSFLSPLEGSFKIVFSSEGFEDLKIEHNADKDKSYPFVIKMTPVAHQ